MATDKRSSFDVMVGSPGGQDHNTIAIGGVDIVVPLERDLDGDPLQDDEIVLRSPDGRYQQRRHANDPLVVEDATTGRLLYKFLSVPHGVYGISVIVAGQPSEVVHDLVVRRQGVFIGGQRLSRDGATGDAARVTSTPETPTASGTSPEPARPADDDGPSAEGSEQVFLD